MANHAARRITAFLAGCAEAGKAAGSWVFDGNSSEATMRAFLQGVDEGDPAWTDQIPAPMWSGEWADEITYEALAKLAGLTPDEADAIYGEACSAFSEAAEAEAVRSALAMLPENETA